MKTVVLGLFDDIDDARRVLGQLASSPLDLSTIEVVRRDVASQAELTREAGLGGRRAPWAALLAGALLGATAGALAGQGPLASLGPLLSLAAGLIIGTVVGAALAGFSDTLRVPPAHAGEMLEAVEAGATAIVVRTDNLPTARAIGDLFTASGSRELTALDAGHGSEEASDDVSEASATPAPSTEHARAVEIPETSTAANQPDAIFAPPWRRGVPQADAQPPPGDSDSPRPSGAEQQPGAADPERVEDHSFRSSAGSSRAAEASAVRGDATRPAQPPPPSSPAPVRFAPLPSTSTGPTPPATPPEPPPPEVPAAHERSHAVSTEPADEPGDTNDVAAATSGSGASSAEPEGVTLADDADIIVLGLAARHARALRDAGLQTVGDVARAMARIENGALSIPGIGPAGARAIREQLVGAGVPPPGEEPPDVRRLLREAIRDVRAEGK